MWAIFWYWSERSRKFYFCGLPMRTPVESGASQRVRTPNLSVHVFNKLSDPHSTSNPSVRTISGPRTSEPRRGHLTHSCPVLSHFYRRHGEWGSRYSSRKLKEREIRPEKKTGYVSNLLTYGVEGPPVVPSTVSQRSFTPTSLKDYVGLEVSGTRPDMTTSKTPFRT